MNNIEINSTPNLLIVIVTYNAMKWIDRCMNSVICSTMRSDIYIIDNGSTDNTVSYIKSNYPKVLLYESSKNLGFGRANNIGLQYALDNHYDYVYLLNQDAWLLTDTLEKLINCSKSHTDFGIISPIQVEANGEHLDKSFIDSVCKNSEYVDDLFYNRRNSIYKQRLVMAAHWLITRECLQKVGGFSPTFPHYGEDNNYASRAIYHGFKVGFTDCAFAIHDREYRIEDVKKIIYMFYIGLLVNFSDPNINKVKLISPNLSLLVRYTIKYKSALPIRYFIKFLLSLKSIVANYKTSIKNSKAFLDDK